MTGIYLAIGVVVLVSFIDHFEKSKVIANQRVRIAYLEREIKKLKQETEQFTTLKQCNK
jgi:Tfp pilus assembly protein PilN